MCNTRKAHPRAQTARNDQPTATRLATRQLLSHHQLPPPPLSLPSTASTSLNAAGQLEGYTHTSTSGSQEAWVAETRRRVWAGVWVLPERVPKWSLTIGGPGAERSTVNDAKEPATSTCTGTPLTDTEVGSVGKALRGRPRRRVAGVCTKVRGCKWHWPRNKHRQAPTKGERTWSPRTVSRHPTPTLPNYARDLGARAHQPGM